MNATNIRCRPRGYVELQGVRYLVRRIERIAQEALAFVSPD
ncbi:hypothetical protein QP166_00625 [Sphingomonas sp. LR60]